MRFVDSISRRDILIGLALTVAAAAAGVTGLRLVQGGGPEPGANDVPSSVRPVDCATAGDTYVVPLPDGTLENKCSIAVEPNLPDPSDIPPPTMHGRYKILAWGSPYEHPGLEDTEPLPGLRETSDVGELQRFDLYAEPAYVPEGYRLTGAGGTVSDGRAYEIVLTYRGDGHPITVRRWLVPDGDQIPIYLPHEATEKVVEETTINGVEAILMYPHPDTIFEFEVLARFIKDGVETYVEARALPIDEVRRIAESIP